MLGKTLTALDDVFDDLEKWTQGIKPDTSRRRERVRRGRDPLLRTQLEASFAACGMEVPAVFAPERHEDLLSRIEEMKALFGDMLPVAVGVGREIRRAGRRSDDGHAGISDGNRQAARRPLQCAWNRGAR